MEKYEYNISHGSLRDITVLVVSREWPGHQVLLVLTDFSLPPLQGRVLLRLPKPQRHVGGGQTGRRRIWGWGLSRSRPRHRPFRRVPLLSNTSAIYLHIQKDEPNFNIAIFQSSGNFFSSLFFNVSTQNALTFSHTPPPGSISHD